MIELLAAIGVGAFVVGYGLGAAGETDDRDAIERFLDDREAQLRERYETTRMDYVEFGDRIALLEDPDTPRIMRDAVVEDGIGPETAFNIAREFDDYEAYRDADKSDYERVNRVGENRARALANRSRSQN